MSVITILGAGVMGSSMCMPFVDRGHAVRLVGTHLDAHIIDSISGNGLHPKLNVTMPREVKPFHHGDFGKALDNDTDLILLGVSFSRCDLGHRQACRSPDKARSRVMITKGMKPEAEDMRAFPVGGRSPEGAPRFDVPVAAIGGACIAAGELAARRHTGTVIVSRDAALAQKLAADFAGDYYMPRASTDMTGVEVCAAFKKLLCHCRGLGPWPQRGFARDAEQGEKQQPRRRAV